MTRTYKSQLFQLRHYEVIAGLLKDSLNKHDFAEKIIVRFGDDNRRFDERRFRMAMD